MAATKSSEGSVKELLRAQAYPLPLYFLQGDEPYFIDELAERIQNQIPEAEKSFNLSILFGRDVNMQTVLSDARQFPFMGERRVLIVKEAQMMDSLEKADDGVARLIAYLPHVQPTTTLVFCYKGKNLDGRKPLAGALKSAGYLFTSSKLADWDSKGLEAIASDLCVHSKVKIDKNGVSRLAQYVGNDISRMANEVAKLRVAVPEGTTVTEETVLNFIGVSRDYSIFEFQKALAYRDFTNALKLAMYYAKNEKEHHILKELAFLTTFFTRLLVLKTYKVKGSSIPDISTLGYRVSPDMDKALTTYSLSQLTNVIHLLAEADRTAKGAGIMPMENAEIWPWLVFRIFEG
jgi:DNA polymerase-3 subunit delta